MPFNGALQTKQKMAALEPYLSKITGYPSIRHQFLACSLRNGFEQSVTMFPAEICMKNLSFRHVQYSAWFLGKGLYALCLLVRETTVFSSNTCWPPSVLSFQLGFFKREALLGMQTHYARGGDNGDYLFFTKRYKTLASTKKLMYEYYTYCLRQ